jgi:hypothetical protein
MFTLVYPEDSPCGCGSGRQFGLCCLKDGQIKLNPKKCEPPSPITWNRHKKCLLGWTNDCCSKISGDHFVSASVLRVLNNEKIAISTASGTRVHSINSSSLKVNRLCRRHNSALSPIDREAARLFSNFARINRHLNEATDGQKLCFFNGTDIERWLLKTLLMVYHSKQTNVNPEHFRLPKHATAMFRYELGRPFGLYLPTKSLGENLAHFRTEPATSVMLITKSDLVCGIEVTLGGLPLRLMIDGHPDDFEGLSQTHTYRPKSLLFFKGTVVYCISFAFADGSGHDIWLSHGDPTAEVPTNY